MEKLRRILVVDGSRVVRATLAKHLKDNFEIREEANGESAWQTLVLDSSIVAVISSVHPPKLEAQDLLQRLRANPLRRLNQLPFLLIASDTGKHTEGADSTLGIADYITKTMPKAEIIRRLQAVLTPCSPIECLGLPEIHMEELPALVSAPARAQVLLSLDEVESRLSLALSSAASRSAGVCALMFGIVNHDALLDQFGEEVAEEIGSRFANLLLAKIGRHDCIGRYPGERLVIVARGVELEECARFATRVCQGLASGHITIRGQQVKLSAAAGAATSLEHDVVSGRGLLTLAAQRLDLALAGGNSTVVTDSRPTWPLDNSGLQLPRILSALLGSNEQAIAAQIGTLGLQILPLLKVINQELALGLQLPEIKRLLQQRADAENGVTSGVKNAEHAI